MIELNYTGICEGCEVSGLKLECLKWDGWHNGKQIVLKKWQVVCDHMEACERWQKEAEAKEAPEEEKPEETDEYRTLAAEAERIKKAVLDVFSKRMNGDAG